MLLRDTDRVNFPADACLTKNYRTIYGQIVTPDGAQKTIPNYGATEYVDSIRGPSNNDVLGSYQNRYLPTT